MRKAAALPLIIIAAVILGGLLYLYGGPKFNKSYINPAPSSVGTSGADVTVLAQGTNATTMDTRVNYRILNADQLAALWQMIYTDSGQPVPNVDFNRYEVLALFDGSHTTGGYDIKLANLKDAAGQRVITITHIAPGSGCVTASGITSPFLILQVPKSSLPITHNEQTVTTQCE